MKKRIAILAVAILILLSAWRPWTSFTCRLFTYRGQVVKLEVLSTYGSKLPLHTFTSVQGMKLARPDAVQSFQCVE